MLTRSCGLRTRLELRPPECDSGGSLCQDLASLRHGAASGLGTAMPFLHHPCPRGPFLLGFYWNSLWWKVILPGQSENKMESPGCKEETPQALYERSSEPRSATARERVGDHRKHSGFCHKQKQILVETLCLALLLFRKRNPSLVILYLNPAGQRRRMIFKVG